MKNKIFFIHIPKTGGTTINNIFKEFYPNDKIFQITSGSAIPTSYHYEIAIKICKNIDPIIFEKAEYISGHIPYDKYVERLKGYDFITFLRNPIQRVISDYNFIITTPRNPLHLIVNELSLQEYVNRNTDLQLDNLQTRIISGRIKGEISNDDLLRAKKNLLEKFMFYGISEKFNSSIALLSLVLDWNYIPKIKKGNVTKRKLKHSNKDIKAIKRYNLFDLELYNFACQHLKSSKFLNKKQAIRIAVQKDIKKHEPNKKTKNKLKYLFNNLLSWKYK